MDRQARRAQPVGRFDEERSELEAERKRAVRAFVKGQMSEAECDAVTGAIDARLASLPSGLAGGVLFGLERLRSVGQVWDGMTSGEKREGLGLLFERVELDMRGKRMWLKPWAEVEEVVRLRREYVCGVPPAGAGRLANTLNSRPWMYMPHELVVA